jgi:hypothetical protein
MSNISHPWPSGSVLTELVDKSLIAQRGVKTLRLCMKAQCAREVSIRQRRDIPQTGLPSSSPTSIRFFIAVCEEVG